MSRIVLVRTTFGSAEEAAQVAGAMVEERLAACASLERTRSVYRWQGLIETSDETAALFKTTADRAAALRSMVAARHSYGLPVIETWEVDVDPAVAEWVYEETAPVS